MNRDDVVRLDDAGAAVLNQPDGEISYEDSIALLTAAVVQRTQALQALVAMQREFRTSLAGLPDAADTAAAAADLTERTG